MPTPTPEDLDGRMPPFPHLFSGNVTISGEPADDGTSIYATLGYWQSQPSTVVNGSYSAITIGHSDWSLHGKTIKFYYGETQASETHVYNGETIRIISLDLTFP
jgi:hypothetical protein